MINVFRSFCSGFFRACGVTCEVNLRFLWFIMYSANIVHGRFEVCTVVTMKNAVFWDVTPCRYCVN
jgi:hypothetical protein